MTLTRSTIWVFTESSVGVLFAIGVSPKKRVTVPNRTSCPVWILLFIITYYENKVKIFCQKSRKMAIASPILYHMKRFRLWFLRYFMRKLMDKRPTIKAVIEPRKSDKPKSVVSKSCLTSKSFLRPVPKRMGTDSKKLSRIVSSFVSPVISPPEIVAPEREIPGTKARH